MKTQNITCLCYCLLLLCTTSWGQVPSLETKASVVYEDVRLEDALEDLNKKFGLKFCYSSNYIPLNEKINISLVTQPLRLILDALFLNIDVVYFIEGDQLVLQKRKQKKTKTKPKSKLTGSIDTKLRKTTPSKTQSNTTPKATLVKSIERNNSPRTNEKVPAPSLVVPSKENNTTELLKSENSPQVKAAPRMTSVKALTALGFDLKREWKNKTIELPVIQQKSKEVLGQVSFLPFLSTNYKNTAEITNKISYNILWGHNGGVDGFEAGGLVNSIKYDVKGVQLAGLGNIVGGELDGTQLSGIFNYNKGKAKGAQGAGVLNVSKDSEALQIAGISNVVTGNFAGVQIGGIANIAKETIEGTQVAGIFNISTSGKATSQVSGIFNVAEDVSKGQVSAIFNKAKKVDGFQVGLINICDTITGASIGLLNFVKKGGYNRFEISTGSELHLSGNYKFGSRYFYNIVQLGLNWNNHGSASWTLGYGLGRMFPFKEERHINTELVVSKVNEGETWGEGLNLLVQARGTYDIKIAKNLSFFVGPSLNVSISDKIQELVPLKIGSALAPYSLLNTTSGDVIAGPEGTVVSNSTNVKLWIGINTGIRF